MDDVNRWFLLRLPRPVFRWFPRLARWLCGYGGSLQAGGRPADMPRLAWWMVGNEYAWKWRNYRHPVSKQTIWESNPAMRLWATLGGYRHSKDD